MAATATLRSGGSIRCSGREADLLDEGQRPLICIDPSSASGNNYLSQLAFQAR
jgi:hypothetical protein